MKNRLDKIDRAQGYSDGSTDPYALKNQRHHNMSASEIENERSKLLLGGDQGIQNIADQIVVIDRDLPIRSQILQSNSAVIPKILSTTYEDPIFPHMIGDWKGIKRGKGAINLNSKKQYYWKNIYDLNRLKI